MRKRQRKKNEKKYVPIMADEFPLLLMTDEERQQAHHEYLAFRKRYAFRKKYKDLKSNRMLTFYYTTRRTFQNLATLAGRIRKHQG